jgi:hypothetical protein
MSNRKKVSVSDFLTVDETITAMKLYQKAREGTFAKKCAKEIITPILPRINEKLGQENDPLFLAYTVEHIFICTGVKEKMQEENNYERNGNSN